MTTRTTKKTTKKEIWDTLSKVNVNPHLKQKGDFPYLPWADAWKIMMEHYPDVTFENEYNDDGYPVFYDPQGRGMVRVSVMVCGYVHTEDYMITNWSNQVVPEPNPSLVNQCLKRAMVKCMAYFGLAAYLYNSEDMTDECPEEIITKENLLAVEKIIENSEDPKDYLKRTLKWGARGQGKEDLKALDELTNAQALKLLAPKEPKTEKSN